MSARYGSRTRTGEAVSGFGQRAVAGGGAVEVTASFSPAPAASTTPVTIDGIEYMVATVTANTTMTTTGPATSIADVVIVAGGGGGGTGGPSRGGGGGGAGGMIDYAIVLGTDSHPLVIGGGGSVDANGSDSSGFGITATGGGYGSHNSGNPGGSGGGGGGNNPPALGGTGISSPFAQGFPGGDCFGPYIAGCGGGGAAGRGNQNWLSFTGVGGPGRSHNLPGSPVFLAGGGNGGETSTTLGTPPGGGGTANPGGTAGVVNSGSGGAGGRRFTIPYVNVATSGGSGVIYVRWQRYQG